MSTKSLKRKQNFAVFRNFPGAITATPLKKRTGRRGFASMDPEKARLIRSMGGKTVALRPGHMEELGRLGGKKVSANRAHMARIGTLGGAARARLRFRCAGCKRKKAILTHRILRSKTDALVTVPTRILLCQNKSCSFFRVPLLYQI